MLNIDCRAGLENLVFWQVFRFLSLKVFGGLVYEEDLTLNLVNYEFMTEDKHYTQFSLSLSHCFL